MQGEKQQLKPRAQQTVGAVVSKSKYKAKEKLPFALKLS